MPKDGPGFLSADAPRSAGAKQIAAAAGVALVVALLFVMLRPAAVAVDLARVASGPMRVTVDEEGKTRVREVYVVSAPVSGRILRAPFDPGDAVIKDKSVVGIIEPMLPTFLDLRTRREVEAAIAAAESSVRLAEADVRQTETELFWATSELTRTKALAERSATSQRALERSRIDVDKQQALLARAKANLELRRAELASARSRLIGPEGKVQHDTRTSCCVEVLAPQSGTVLRQVQDSETVIAGGAALLEIGDPSDMEIVVELLSTDAVKLAIGAEAVVDGAGLPKPLAATLKRIEPAGFTKVSALGIEEQRVKVRLDPVGPSSDWTKLGHEFRVFVRITSWSGDDVLQVPLSALFRQGDQWSVFRESGGRARVVKVEIGHRNSKTAEVVGGLKAGDSVILYPSDRVSDGVRIRNR